MVKKSHFDPLSGCSISNILINSINSRRKTGFPLVLSYSDGFIKVINHIIRKAAAKSAYSSVDWRFFQLCFDGHKSEWQ